MFAKSYNFNVDHLCRVGRFILGAASFCLLLFVLPEDVFEKFKVHLNGDVIIEVHDVLVKSLKQLKP